MGMAKKISELDHRIIFGIVFVVITIPLITPIILPFPVTSYTRDYWHYISETIPDGSVVGHQSHIGPSNDPQLGSGNTLTIAKLFQKECKIMFFSLDEQAPSLTKDYIANAEKIIGRDLEYGVDYVRLGFIPGEEIGLVALLDNIPAYMGGIDMYGNALADMPIMDGIVTGGDIKDAIWAGGAKGSEDYAIRQWGSQYGTRMASILITMMMPAIMPYLPTGQLQGVLSGLSGSAEMEFLMKEPGLAYSQRLAVSMGGLMFFTLLVIGNASYMLSRRREA